MRRLVRWIAGLVSIAALAKLVSRLRADRGEPVDATPEPDPAEELRRKLAEVRAAAPVETAGTPEAPSEAPAPPAPEGVSMLPDDEPAPEPPPQPTIEERRAAIHARAQEAIDAMKEGDA